MSWTRTTLGSHVDVVSGPAFKSELFTDDPNDVPLVKGENIGQGEVLWDKSKYWPRQEADRFAKYRLTAGDVVVAMDRPWVTAGLKFARITDRDPESLLVQRVARLRGTNGLAPQLVKHIIASPDFTAYVKNIMGGTNVPHISGDQIRAFAFTLPPRPQQEAIASILTAYDDLIENNTRRIKLLEDAARLLYEEWFVRLRFPGHEHTPVRDGVPEGWSRRSFSSLAEFLNGFAFKPIHLGDTGFPIVKIPELRSGPLAKTPRTDAGVVPAQYRLDTGDMLFSWSGTLLVNIWSWGPALLNQHLFKVTPHTPIHRSLVYLGLLHALEVFHNQTTGATMKHIRRGALDAICTLVPSDVLAREFESLVGPMLSQRTTLRRLSAAAAAARDLLLPRLMSGEVAV